MPKVNLSDPYLIAFLRGGKNEALRVVTMSLVDRNLLAAAGTKIGATEGAWGKARSELEQKIVKHFTPSAEASSLFKTKEAEPEMRQYENELTRLGLLPDSECKRSAGAADVGRVAGDAAGAGGREDHCRVGNWAFEYSVSSGARDFVRDWSGDYLQASEDVGRGPDDCRFADVVRRVEAAVAATSERSESGGICADGRGVRDGDRTLREDTVSAIRGLGVRVFVREQRRWIVLWRRRVRRMRGRLI